MCRNNILLSFTLVCLVIGVLAALNPFVDMDHDGLLDSLITEGFILTPALCSVTGLLLLLTRLPVACLAAPRLFSCLYFLPPILN